MMERYTHTKILEAGKGDSPNPWSVDDDDNEDEHCESWWKHVSKPYINHLKDTGNHLYHPVANSAFCPHSVFMGFVWFSV
jgi:hypothetical protein